jgi:hypothetical protein
MPLSPEVEKLEAILPAGRGLGNAGGVDMTYSGVECVDRGQAWAATAAREIRRRPTQGTPRRSETAAMDALQVWTVGHSTRSIDEFLRVLAAYRIETVADVRRFPGSRRHPQFGGEALATSLRSQGVEYEWIEQLGGRRRRSDAGAPSAWRHPSFQAYGDHIASPEFAEGLDRLLHLAQASRTAIMCSELLWWRCHRAIISDVLVFAGVAVTHILTAEQSTPHSYTSPARIVDGELSYAPIEDAAT